MQQKTVSVISPVYNVAPFLHDFLESVIAQTLSSIELICVDDGSTDDSAEIISKYAAKDTRIRLIRQQNQGAGKARNAGIRVAQGEYIAFMDPDDMYPSKDTLQHMYDAAVKNDVDICGGSLNWLIDGKLETDSSRFDAEFTFKQDGMVAYKDYQFDYCYVRFLYRRSFVQKHGLEFPDYLRQQDPPFMVKVFCLAKQFYALKEPTYVYRVGHKTVEWNERKAHDLFCGVYDVLNCAIEFGMPKLYERVVRRLNSWTYRTACTEMMRFPSVRNQVLKLLKRVLDCEWYNSLSEFELDDIFKAVETSRKSEAVVSVIVPVYNVEKYLARCLDSILAQTFPWMEILCVNDGSTDGSPTILDKYAHKDPRIKVLDKPNGGLSSARNWGMDRAHGDYIMFVDSDDWIDSTTLEKAVAKMSGNVDVVCWGAELRPEGVDAKGQNMVIGSEYHKIRITGQKEMSYPVIKATTYTVWNKLFKRRILDQFQIRFVEGRLFEDNDFTTNYFAHCRHGHFLGEYLYHYMQRPGSIMDRVRARQSDKAVDNLYIFDSLYSHFERWGMLDKYPGMIADRYSIHLRYAFRYAPDSKRAEVRETASQLAEKYDPKYFRENIVENLRSRNYAAVRDLFELVFSLTTFPARINHVHEAVESLLAQRAKADHVVLTLCEKEFPNHEKDLPPELLGCVEKGLEVIWTKDNLKAHKKYFSAMQKYPDAVIVTFDDDIVYPNWIVGKLLGSYARFPHCVSALRVHLVKFDEHGEILPYRDWDLCSQEYLNHPNAALLATGGAGALYPPGEYRKHFLDKKLIQKYCLNADDIWMKFVEWRQDVPVVVPTGGSYPLTIVDGTQEVNLYSANLLRDENDVQLANLLKAARGKARGESLSKRIYRLSKEAAVGEGDLLPLIPYRNEKKPIVSIILLSCNAGQYLDRSLESLEKQTCHDVEIVVVDNGSTDNSAEIIRQHAENDSRYHVIFLTRHTDGYALNKGIDNAKGDYVFFQNARDFVVPKQVEKVLAALEKNPADLVVFNGSDYNSAKQNVVSVKAGMGPVFKIGHPFIAADYPDMSFTCYGVYPWNKAIRREFLTREGERFCEDLKGIDYGFTIGVVLRANQILAIAESLYFCRDEDFFFGKMCDEDPSCVLDMLLRTKRTIESLGCAEVSKRSFRCMAYSECLRALSSFSKVVSFEQLYNSLRNGGFRSLEIDENCTQDLGYGQYMQYATIMRSETAVPLFMMLLSQTKRSNAFLRMDLRNKALNVGAGASGKQSAFSIDKIPSWRLDCRFSQSEVKELLVVAKGECVRVDSPSWVKSNGRDGQIVTCACFSGRVEFRSSGTGILTIELRCQDISTKDGKGTVPFCIDYTSVKVQGKEMLNELKTVRCDRPYKFTVNVQAGETVEIAVETVPHVYERAVLRDMLLKAKLPFEVNAKNVDRILNAPEMAAFLLRPQEEFARALATWCMDAHYVEKEVGALEVAKKDEGVRVAHEAWMKTADKVYQRVTCTKFVATVAFKSKGAGKVNIALLGQDLRASADDKKQMLVPVDFVSVKVRGKEVLSGRTVADRTHPAWFTIDVKAGETVEIVAETAPHAYRREELKDLMLKVKWPVAIPANGATAWLDDLVLKSFIAAPVDLKLIENQKLQITTLQAEVKKGEERKSQIAKLQADLKKGEGQKTQIAKLQEELRQSESRRAASDRLLEESRRSESDIKRKMVALQNAPGGGSDRQRRQEAFISSLSTWCVDTHYVEKEVGAFEVVTASDGVRVERESWMKTKDKVFQRLTCAKFGATMAFKSKGAGKVNVALLGQDLRAVADGKTRMLVPVDFVSVKVRGKEVLLERTVADRAHPAWFTIDVKAGETIEIVVETAPHAYRREELKDLMLKVKWPVAVPAQSVDAWLDDLVLKSFIAVPIDLKSAEKSRKDFAAQKNQIENQRLQISKLQDGLKRGEDQKSEILKLQTALHQSELRPVASKRSLKEMRRVAALERLSDENARRAEELLMRLQEANAHAEAEAKKVEELEKRLAAAQEAAVREKRKTEAKEQEVAALKASEAYAVGMSLTKPARAIKRALMGKK